jgi:glycyl-tRNA synthetase
LTSNHLQLFHQPAEDLSHYSKADHRYLYHFPHGVEELEGIANRTDFDLGFHSKKPEELGLSAHVLPNADSSDQADLSRFGQQ